MPPSGNAAFEIREAAERLRSLYSRDSEGSKSEVTALGEER